MSALTSAQVFTKAFGAAVSAVQTTGIEATMEGLETTQLGLISAELLRQRTGNLFKEA